MNNALEGYTLLTDPQQATQPGDMVWHVERGWITIEAAQEDTGSLWPIIGEPVDFFHAVCRKDEA